MKKFIVLAGIAASLLTAAPAFADNWDHGRGRDNGYSRDYRGHDRDYRRDYHRGYERAARRDFDHWRPGLERSRYYGFGRPVFYDHYYRVPCRDYRGRVVLLTVDAYSGAILSVGF